MTTIALYGATGKIGQRILNEALARGHKVTAIVRDATRASDKRANLDFKPGDILKPESVAAATKGYEVVVSAYGPGAGDAHQIAKAADSLVEGLGVNQPVRLIFVGGAGSLEVSPGLQLVDTPTFHKEWKPPALAHREALQIFRSSTIEWTYLSPAAIIEPGSRTGKYRLGKDQLVVNEKGESRISMEDYAKAIVDEIENPQFPRQRFTLAY